MKSLKDHERSSVLRDAAINGQLTKWTKTLTKIVVSTCGTLHWSASAKGHASKLLPIERNEYLSIDVMAFSNRNRKWNFPVAVFELENSIADDVIEYSLWKLLCVHARNRFIFCYRKKKSESSSLIHKLKTEVIGSLSIEERMNLYGDSVVVVGSKSESETFPFGFFHWWQLNKNTGSFQPI